MQNTITSREVYVIIRCHAAAFRTRPFRAPVSTLLMMMVMIVPRIMVVMMIVAVMAVIVIVTVWMIVRMCLRAVSMFHGRGSAFEHL